MTHPLDGLMLLALDFETYWDKDYTLRKLPTSVYVRDSRFKAYCLGVMHDDAAWPRVYSGREMEKFLRSVNWNQVAVVAHHAHFDGLIMSHRFNVKPAFWIDTLSMARALHGSDVRSDLDTVLKLHGFRGKLGDVLKHTKGVRDLPPVLASFLSDYCRGDVVDLLAMAKKMIALFPVDELRKIDVFVRMFTEPVLQVDREKTKRELTKERSSKSRTINKSGATKKELRSRETFAELLRSKGIEPPKKIKTNKAGEQYQTYAFAKTDQDFIALLSSGDDEIRELVEAKLASSSSIGETRAEALLERSEGGMNLPIYLNYAKAHTLRTTGGDKFNPQNFPARNGDALRQCIVAPPGWEIVTLDSAQIEARLNGWQAGQKDLLDAFRKKRDIYAEMASSIWNTEITKKSDPGKRFVGKVVVLAAGYMMSAARLQISLALGASGGEPVFLDYDVCKKAIDTYRRKNAYIVASWRKFDNLIAHMANGRGAIEHGCARFVRGGIEMPNGLKLKYPNLHMTDEGWRYTTPYGKSRSLYGGKLVENFVQSLAYIVASDQMLEIARRFRAVMFEHDANTLLVRRKDVDKAIRFGMEVMREPPKWAPDLPLEVEAQHGKRYMK